MNLLTRKEFLRHISEHGIRLDPDDNDSLSFATGGSYSRFWTVPQPASQLPYFIMKILESLDPWESCLVWKRCSCCFYPGGKTYVGNPVWEYMVRSIGIQEGF